MTTQAKTRLVTTDREFPGLAPVIEIGDGTTIVDMMTLGSTQGDLFLTLPEGHYIGQDIMLRRVRQFGTELVGIGNRLKVSLARSTRGPQGFMTSGGNRYLHVTFIDPNGADLNVQSPAMALLRWTGTDWLVYGYTYGVQFQGVPPTT